MLLYNLNFYHDHYRSLPFCQILGKFIQLHLVTYFPKVCFNIILPYIEELTFI